MSVVLLESDPFARSALHSLLSQLGLRRILSARTVEEAWFYVRSQGSSLRFILAEQREPFSEATQLLERVAGASELERVPFLLINSNVSFAGFRPLRHLPRLDGWLKKPFGSFGLFDAMARAELKRHASRPLLVVLESEAGNNARQGLEERVGPRSLWREIVSVGSLRELAALESSRGSQISAVLIEPGTYERSLARGERDWLPRFKRSGGGGRIPCVCLSRSPGIPQTVRSFCSLFVEPLTTVKAAHALLTDLEWRVRGQFAVRVYLSLSRTCLKEHNYRLAARCAEAAFRLDGTKVEAVAFLAESQLKVGRRASAIKVFRKALAINPFHPQAYVRLLDLTRGRSGEWASIRDEALRFCPQHPGVLQAMGTGGGAA